MREVIKQLQQLAVERPVGSVANQNISEWFVEHAKGLGCEVKELSFPCMEWKKSDSTLKCDGLELEIIPAPFSLGINVNSTILRAKSKKDLQQLSQAEVTGRILCLEEELTIEPLMPKDFPFYYPEEHRWLNDTLEELRPAAILSVTGKHPLTGENPFPLTDDGAFNIPSASLGKEKAESLFQLGTDQRVDLNIVSRRHPSSGIQPMAFIRSENHQEDTPLVLIGAHLDTKYDTPGALDNATGVTTLMQLMKFLRNGVPGLELLFIPFNGEEHYQVPGQLAALKYLEAHMHRLKLMINLDGLGHKNGKTALSAYNLDPETETRLNDLMKHHPIMTCGDSWVEGDHSMFSFQGISCLALTSSNLLTEVTPLAHTQADTLHHVDPEIIIKTAVFLADAIRDFASKTGK